MWVMDVSLSVVKTFFCYRMQTLLHHAVMSLSVDATVLPYSEIVVPVRVVSQA